MDRGEGFGPHLPYSTTSHSGFSLLKTLSAMINGMPKCIAGAAITASGSFRR